MAHSKEQHRKKAEAREEALDHLHNSSVIHPRGGRDHEAHKNGESEREERMEHGMKVGRE